MDINTARWSRIVQWEMADILELHRLESLLAAQSKQSEKDGKSPLDWQAPLAPGPMDWMRRMDDRYMMSPFWPEKMDEGAKANEIREFERRIYPIWKSIFEKSRRADENAKSSAEFIPEHATMHKCDIAIHRSGIKPDRVFIGQRDMEKLRAKEAMGQKFVQTYE